MAKELKKAADETTALALQSMYEEDVDAGFESADKDSYAIPMLNILQSLSPQVDESEGEYIEGAKPGMMFNNVSGELYGNTDGLVVVPCAYRRGFVEWRPRESGGGFVAEYSVAEAEELLEKCVRNDKNQDVLPNGNLLVDTRTHYVLRISSDGAYEPAVMAMSSTQLKKSRKWMSRMKNIKFKRADGSQFTPPMYANMWKFTTVPESNDKGKWHGWKEELVGVVEDPQVYRAAKEFKELVSSGELNIKRTESTVPDPEEDDIPY